MTVLNDFGEPSTPMPRKGDDFLWDNVVPWVLERIAPILQSNPNIINDDGGVNWLQFAGSAGQNAITGGTAYTDPTTGERRFQSVFTPGAEDYLNAYDASIDVVNTVAGSTAAIGLGFTSAALAGDWSASSNPYMRDGLLSWDEVDQMYNPLKNDTTLGQQIVTGFNRIVQNGLLTATGIVAGEDVKLQFQTALQEYVDEQNRLAEEDPENTDQLGSWTQIFDYNFNQYDRWQRESAFETMGPTKFLSGGLDATWQIFGAPEVIIAKGFSAAKYANATMKFATPEGRAVARRELVEHNMYRMSEGTVGKVTATGLLAESLATMSPRQVRKHVIAIRSSNPEMVANVLGELDDPKAVGDALLAMSGDRAAMTNFHVKYPALADKIRYQQEQVDALKSEIDNAQSALDDFAADPSGIDNVLAPDVGPENLRNALKGWVRNQAAIRATALRNGIDLKSGEIKTLEASLEAAQREIPGLRAAATVDAAILRDTYIPGSNGVRAAEKAALKKAARQAGDWTEYRFRIPGGRPITVIRSAADKLTTKRATGQVHVTDDAEFYAEIDSVLNNNHAYRKAAKAPEGSPDRMIKIYELKESEAGRMVETVREVDAVAFRKEMMNRALSLTPGSQPGKSLAALRWEFTKDLEKVMFFDLLDRYGVSRTRAFEVFENFKYMRNKVAEQIKERGWVKEDGEIVLVPDLQSQVEETYMMLDLDFIETVLRLQRSGAGKRAFDGGRRGFNEIARVFDMFWRPLALMRLGYTQRNVAEGWLRTLAAYGSIASMSDLQVGGSNFLTNMGWRFASVKQGVSNTVTRTPSVKRLRENMSNDIGYMKEQGRIVNGLETEVSGYDARIEQIRRSAEKRILGSVRAGVSDEFRAGESVVWDDVASDASARIGEDWLDYADEFWVDPGNATKFGNVGFESVFDVTQAGIRREGGSPALTGGENPLLTPTQTRRMNQIAYADGDAIRLTDVKHLDEYRSLWVEGNLRRAEREISDGGVLVMWNKDGTYSRVRDARSIFETAARGLNLEGDSVVMDTRLDDAVANLAVLPKGTQVKAVRSTVYGRTLDLRNTVDEEWSDVIDFLRGGVRKKDLVGPSGKRVTDTGRVVRQVHALLYDRKPTGKNVQDVTWKQVKDLKGILEIMDEDPDFARAIYAKMWASSLPKNVRQALQREGLIIPSETISRALSDRLGGLRSAQGKVADQIEDIRQTLADEAMYLRTSLIDGGAFHGGRRVPDDVLEDEVRLTEASMENWAGPGFYSTSDGTIAGGYLVGNPGGTTTESLGKAIEDSLRDGGEPVFYQTMPPIKEAFLDLDQEIIHFDPYAEADEFITLAKQQQLDDQNALIEEALAEAERLNGAPINSSLADVYEVLDYRLVNEQNPMSVSSIDDRTTNGNMRDLMLSFVEDMTTKGIPEDVAWQAWTNTVKANGYDGVRHIGGRNMGYDPHEVYLWYEAPEVTRLDEISDLGLESMRLYKRFGDYKDSIARTLELRDNAQAMRSVDITGVRNVYDETVPIPGAAGQVDFIGVDRLTKVARELGYGKILVDSPTTVEGYTTTYLHDMVSANRGSADPISRAVPDYIYQSFTADTNAVGEAVQRPLLDLANATDNPYLPTKDWAIVEKARTPVAAGQTRFTQAERARLIQMLEESGNTHVSVLHEGGKVSYLTKSQLMRSRKVADEFLAMTRGDEIKARVEQILSKDDAYVSLQAKRTEAAQQLTEASSTLNVTRQRVYMAAQEVAKRTKQKPKKRIGQGTQEYKGIEYADAFNENYQGSYAMAQSSSAATNARDIVGYTDDQTRSMRRTYEDAQISQASDVYWQEMEILANRKVRNDKVSLMILEGKTDDEIIEWLKSGTTETKAISRDSFPAKPGPDGRLVPDYEKGLSRRKEILDNYFPDRTVRAKIVEGEIQIADLIKGLSWRDLPDIDGRVWADLDNGWQKFTTKIMHALGTVPEDTLVRHPFYRNRFNEEMRRQIDMFNGKEIGEQELSAFRRASHTYALKSTRETLYTVTRLSTPAYALRFVVPFFPAWESSMKFWSKQFIDKPVTLVRYAQLVNAPYAGGWVVDENGNPVEDRRRSFAIPQALFSNGGGSIIVPWFGSKESGKNIGSMRIPIASLNVILPGDYPWMPTADPLVQIPLSYIATKQPTAAQALADFKAFDIPIGDIVTKSALPFGQPYDEKDFLDMAAAAALPATAQRLISSARGESSTDFLRAVDEIYRTKMTNWELNGRQGKAPNYEEALEDANALFRFRAIASLVLPFAATPQSPYQFYIEESRRLDEMYAGQPDGMEKADEEFIRLYGTEFFRYTKSLSGSRGSGIDPTATAMSVYEGNKRLGGRIARLGDRGELLQMMTDGFAPDDEFAKMTYAIQQGMAIEGAPGRFLRGGPNSESIITGSAAEDATQIDLGWREFENMNNMINASLAEAGLTNINQSPEMLAIKQATTAELKDMYPAWGRDYDKFDSGKMTERLWVAQMMLSDKNFMSQHGNAPHIQGLAEYMEVRQEFVNALAQAKAGGGSDRIDAVSNEAIRAVWLQTQEYFTSPDRDPTWVAYYNRWLIKDPLLPVPAIPQNMIGGD